MPELIISTRVQLPSIVYNPRLGKRDRWVDHPAWEKFSTDPSTYTIKSPTFDPVRKYLMTRAQRLKEKYNAEVKFNHDRGLGVLTFDTDEDMMLFLMEWS